MGKEIKRTPFGATLFNVLKLYGFTMKEIDNSFNEGKEKYDRIDIQHYTSSDMPAIGEQYDKFIDCFEEYFEKQFNSNLSEIFESKCDSLQELFNNLTPVTTSETFLKYTLKGNFEDIRVLLQEAYNYSISLSFAKIEHAKPELFIKDNYLCPTQYFIGRDAIVSDIFNKFCIKQNKNKEAEKVKTKYYLHGIGGMGKTEILKAVINKLANEPISKTKIKKIYWINLPDDNQQEEESFRHVFIDAVSVGLNDYTENQYNKCINDIQNIGDNALIVIDNIVELNDYLIGFLNKISEAKILLAGRPEPQFDEDKIGPIPVDKLEREECKSLFKKYYNYNDADASLVEDIIELVDRHTVTIEMLAKLAKYQDISLVELTSKLEKSGLNFKFKEQEEKVSSCHQLLKKEDIIINQLSRLFSTVNLNDKDKDLLIKISVIPNLPFSFNQSKIWFNIQNKTELRHLTESGWIKAFENSYSIHSIIAEAVRKQHYSILHDTCKPMIELITKDLYEMFLDSNRKGTFNNKRKILLQFSWSIADIFQNKFEDTEDLRFLLALSEIYKQIGFITQAENLSKRITDIDMIV